MAGLHKDTTEPKVAVVIVNWNKKNYVLNLLSSLQQIEYNQHDIIVVENGSTDGSAESIKTRFPAAHLIMNNENLGGTGGFNSGMRFILEEGNYKYVWLLDNDAEIESSTLNELVSAMEADDSIGIAGSRIMDVNDRDVTIESGAFFLWETIGVKPLYRNEKDIDISNAICNVDYVAICSALVRTSALKKVGLMDERYFLFWDDMDWGLQFKKNNFRVVAVLTSIAYHPPFTEKRTPFVDFYYGYRNPLLTYAKHAELLKRLAIYFKHLRYCSKVLIFLGLNGRRDIMSLGLNGIYDFIVARWGGRKFKDMSRRESVATFYLSPDKLRNVIILNTGNKDEIYGALSVMKELYPGAIHTLLIQDDRVGMFPGGFDNIIQLRRDKPANVFHLMSIFLKILVRNYDMAVVPNYPSPFSYAVKRVYTYNHFSETIIENKANRKNIWKLILATTIGEILGMLLVPFVFIRSIFYHKS